MLLLQIIPTPVRWLTQDHPDKEAGEFLERFFIYSELGFVLWSPVPAQPAAPRLGTQENRQLGAFRMKL